MSKPARTSSKERYAVKDDTTITPLHQPGSVIDPLTEIARDGARRMLAAALRAEAASFVAQFTDERLPDGRQRVVHHGTGPERTIPAASGCSATRCVSARPTGRPRRGSASPPASCRDGPGARRASMPCCLCSTCAASPPVTSKKRWPQSWGRRHRTCRPAWFRA